MEIVYKLHGRSGIGVDGLAPLTYDTVIAWADRVAHVELDEDEIDALLDLDLVMITAGRDQAATPTPNATGAR